MNKFKEFLAKYIFFIIIIAMIIGLLFSKSNNTDSQDNIEEMAAPVLMQ